MATSYSTNLALALPVTGELSGTWGTVVNSNITNMLDEALGYQAYTATGGADTITIPDGTTGVARSIYIQLNGTGGGSVAVPTAKTKMYFVFNNTASAITFKVTGQTGVSIPAAAKMALVSNGTDIITAENYFAALTLGAALPVASGGTGTATPSIVAGTNVTVSGTWPNQTVNASSSGTVSSVAATVPSIFSISGSPITTSGTLAMTYSGTALPIANGGTGTTSTTFANLTTNVTGTLPIANGGTGTTSTTFANLTTNVTGTLPVANGGTGATTLTANNVILGNGTSAPTFVAPSTSGNVLTSNGTTWTSAAAGGASALVLLSTVTASASATVDVETTFSSTYDNYVIVGTVTCATDSAALTSLFKISGSYVTSGYYWHASLLGAADALYNANASTNTSSFRIGGNNGPASGSSLGFVMYIYNASSTSLTKKVSVTGASNRGTTYQSIISGGGNTGTGALTGIRFQADVGNITGTFRLYGIAK